MKVLIVCSKNSGKIAPFISDQVVAIQKFGIEIDFFTIEQKGVLGYLKSRKGLVRKIKEFNPTIIHAHFGLSGLLANLQRKIPVVTTYHGSDINVARIFRFSRLSIIFSKHNIFVSKKNIEKANVRASFSLIPCGVDVAVFRPMEKDRCRENLNISKNQRIVLFAGSFNNDVKNSALAKKAIELIENVELVELKDYTRDQVSQLMNAADVCLMTSHSEGSPQFIKEAMACNCPIVSVDVGDVKEVIEGVEGCHIAERNAMDVALKIEQVLIENRRTNGYEKIKNSGYEAAVVTEKIKNVYQNISLKNA